MFLKLYIIDDKQRNESGTLQEWHCKGLFTHSMPCPCRSPAMPFVNSHIACRAHAVPLPCHSLIHTFHAVPLPSSDSAMSFVKVRVVAGNI